MPNRPLVGIPSASLQIDADNPTFLQMSQGGAAYLAGKGVDNKDQFASSK